MSRGNIFRNTSIKLYEHVRQVAPWISLTAFLYLLLMNQANAEGTNYLSGLKGDVSATFGKGSDLPTYMYWGEAAVAGVTWLKTKSPWVFVGLPLLMIFTHWAFQ